MTLVQSRREETMRRKEARAERKTVLNECPVIIKEATTSRNNTKRLMRKVMYH